MDGCLKKNSIHQELASGAGVCVCVGGLLRLRWAGWLGPHKDGSTGMCDRWHEGSFISCSGAKKHQTFPNSKASLMNDATTEHRHDCHYLFKSISGLSSWFPSLVQLGAVAPQRPLLAAPQLC